MAIAFVGGTTATKAGATSGNTTIALNSGLTGGSRASVQAGDLVIAVFATGAAADRTLAITDGTTGYTLIGSELYANGTTYDTNLRVAYKFMGSTPDTSTTFGPTGNAQDAGAMCVYVFSGVDSGTPLDVAATTATGTGTGRPNGASILPTTTGAYVVVAGGGAAGTGAVYTQSGTELSGFKSATSVDTNDAMMGIGYFAWTSGTFDPVVWTGGTTNAADSWAAVTVALRPSAPTNYPLTANSGSYSVTGSSATVSKNRAVTSSSGSYALTGESATITKVKSYPITALSGAYSLTGRAAEIRYVQTLPASVAHLLTEAGDNLAQEDGFLLAIEPLEFIVTTGQGSYSYAGSNATIKRGLALTASSGAYSLTGQSATLLKTRVITASSGSYALSGQTATIRRSKSVTSSSGTYSITGQAATLAKGRSLTASAGSYALSGQAATVLRSKSVTASSGAYSLTGQSSTLVKGKSLTANSGSYSLTGQSADITKTTATSYTVTALSGSYSLTGQTATLQKSKAVTASSGSYALTGQSATVYRNRSLTANSGTYDITGQSADLTHGIPGAYSITALSGSYSLTGQPATISLGASTQVTGGSGNGNKSKRVYLEEDGKVLVFANASRAAAYLAQKKAENAAETVTEASSKPVAKKEVQKVRPKETEPLQVISIDVLQLLALQYGYEDTLSPILRQHEYAALIALYEQVMFDRDEEEVLMLLLA